jgi:hypothetical protein
MLGFTLHTPMNRLYAPKVSDPPPLQVYKTRPVTEPLWEAIAADMNAFSGGWGIRQSVSNRKHCMWSLRALMAPTLTIG